MDRLEYISVCEVIIIDKEVIFLKHNGTVKL